MKEKIHYVIEAVLAVAVIILFVFQFSGNNKASDANAVISGIGTSSGENMPIAYIDVDTLISNYVYALDLNEQLSKRRENSQAILVERGRKYETEVIDYQRKMQTNTFLSQERAKSEEERILKMRDDLQRLEAQLEQEIVNEHSRMGLELRNSIILHLREYNKNKKYQVIYGKSGDNILYADDAYNITWEIIDFFNKSHAASPVSRTNE